MKLVIHAGIHRTGTSSLQDFLASNRDDLRERGVLYPGEAKNHQQLAWAIKRGDAGAADILKIIQDDQGACETTVLSAEDFCIHQDLSWLEEISSHADTSAHFYLRRQDHWLMSWYNQHIKWPFDPWKSQMSPEEFFGSIDDFYWIDFANLIGRWEKVLGEASVRVSIVECGHLEDVTTDFIQHIGIAHDELPSPAKRANNSMPVHLLEIARHLGLQKMSPNQRIRIIGVLNRVFPTQPGQPKTVYSPEQRRNILDRFADSNRSLAQRRFQRPELFLEEPPSDSEPFYQFPELGRDEFIREWINPVIHDLLKK